MFLLIFRKSCITSENQFDFLKDLVANVPDLPSHEEEQDGEPKQKRLVLLWISLLGWVNTIFSEKSSIEHLEQGNIVHKSSTLSWYEIVARIIEYHAAPCTSNILNPTFKNNELLAEIISFIKNVGFQFR